MVSDRAIQRVARRTVERFVREWQANPLWWAAEADVHAELFGRLRRAYRAVGQDRLEGNYRWYSDRGIPGRQFWCRVACKPPVRLHSGRIVRPDLVVGQKIGDPSHPPDEKLTGTWPLLWVCEIKCESLESLAYDRTKVRRLLKENPAMEGMCLELNLTSGQARYAGRVAFERTVQGGPEEESVGPCLCEAPMRLDHELRPVDGHLGDLALGEVRNVGSRVDSLPRERLLHLERGAGGGVPPALGDPFALAVVSREASDPRLHQGQPTVGSRGRWGGS